MYILHLRWKLDPVQGLADLAACALYSVDYIAHKTVEQIDVNFS